MKIIVPMAGRGSRLRPHTLTTPKPLIPVAGMPIVERLVRDIAALVGQPISDIGFVLGDPAFFGDDVVEQLNALAKDLGAKAHIFRQNVPLGTGHAIMCAAPLLSGPAVVAYADTLIRADFDLDPDADAAIWVKQVDDPQAYGVVQLDSNEDIQDMVEKPQEFVSDLAAIGIYYFKEIAQLRDELQGVIDEQLTRGGEYQINDGILRMIQKGKRFVPCAVNEWMDCGNPEITIQTNQKMLHFLHEEGETLVATHTNENSTIIAPCYIGEGVKITNSTVGPYVALGSGTQVENCTIENSIVQTQSRLTNAHIKNAMIGNHVEFDGNFTTISLGDYSKLS
jgi:glucose-1-phosphate thymidylyltransferase